MGIPGKYDRIILFAVFLFLYLIPGYFTVDIIHHWDEAKLVNAVITQYSKGSLLPAWYNYPPGIFYITYLDYTIWKLLLQSFVTDFNFFNRLVFYTLSGIPFFILYRSIKKEAIPSIFKFFLPVLFFASWEFHYHSRWVAPDTLMAVSGFISLYYCNRIREKNAWLYAAVFAAIATGFKYTGAIFLLPVLMVSATANPAGTLKKSGLILLVFTLCILIIIPGIIVDHAHFIQDIEFEKKHYASGHNNYTVSPGTEHLLLSLQYIFVMLSPVSMIAILLLLVFFYGVVSSFKNMSARLTISVLIMLGIYIAYMSSQKVMFVRNLQLIWPVMAWYSITGLARMAAKYRYPGYVLITVFSFMVLSPVIRKDILTVFRPGDRQQLASLSVFYKKHPEVDFVFSRGIKQTTGFIPPKTSLTHTPEKYAVFWLQEINQQTLPANNTWIIRDLGAGEVNINYYPTWINNRRIIITPVKNLSDSSDSDIFNTEE